MGVAVPLETIDKLSGIHDPEEWKREVFRMIGNRMPKVNGNRVLAVVYISPDVHKEITTEDGNIVKIYKSADSKKEDIWQGKPMMVLAVGSEAYKDTVEYTHGDFSVKPGDWITTRISNCEQFEYMKLPMRIVQDYLVSVSVDDPRLITS